jgi:hypothetical protein
MAGRLPLEQQISVQIGAGVPKFSVILGVKVRPVSGIRKIPVGCLLGRDRKKSSL